MNLLTKNTLSLFLFLFILSPAAGQGTVTDLRIMGYAVFPTPQKVDLDRESIIIDGSWQILP